MVARCIFGMVNSFRKNPTLLPGVALVSKTNADHQPGVQDPLAPGEITWQEENRQCRIRPLLEWLQA